MKSLLKNVTGKFARVMVMFVVGLVLFGFAENGFAHCDTLAGPVVQDAKLALEKGDVTSTLKWVGKGDEAEVKAAFKKTLAVRGKGTDVQELADRYFFETLVRLHRAGEGAPYTGLKDAPVEPVVALAEKALTDGSAEVMSKELSAKLTKELQAKHAAVVKAQKGKDKSVKAGRKYVEAYVEYMHYVEGLHSSILAEGHHAKAEHSEHE